MLFYQNLLRVVDLINFHLFSPNPSTQNVHLFTISGKNQDRLTWKIVDSYSRVFTVSYIDKIGHNYDVKTFVRGRHQNIGQTILGYKTSSGIALFTPQFCKGHPRVPYVVYWDTAINCREVSEKFCRALQFSKWSSKVLFRFYLLANLSLH